MKRWGVAFLVVLLACIPIYSPRPNGQDLLKDTDTAVLLAAVRARHQPLSWFAGDWPLQNHFYRPMPTLAFEMDNALYGNHATGYGRTNALLAIACVLLLFWFLRELTANPMLTAASSCLFAFWSADVAFDSLAVVLWYGAWLSALLFLILLLSGMPLSRRLAAKKADEDVSGAVSCVLEEPEVPQTPSQDTTHKTQDIPSRPQTAHIQRLKIAAAAFFTLLYASFEVGARGITEIDQLNFRVVGWLPGRTASVMTVFALIAMAAYARYERISAARVSQEPSPLGPPATKGTEIRAVTHVPWVWAVVACFATALALASYEQAVMLPAALLGVAVSFRLQRYKPRWAWQIPFWILLIGYLVLRKQLIPPGISGYQRQQFRNSVSVYLSILGYAFPKLPDMWQTLVGVEPSIYALFGPQIWTSLLMLTSNVVAYANVRKRMAFALTGLALSVITFLPMAWMKQFEHYAYWPMAMRSLFATTLCWVAIELFVTAVSRPGLQAPKRLDPAPGSLPHR